jgi:hypothetical protein
MSFQGFVRITQNCRKKISSAGGKKKLRERRKLTQTIEMFRVDRASTIRIDRIGVSATLEREKKEKG